MADHMQQLIKSLKAIEKDTAITSDDGDITQVSLLSRNTMQKNVRELCIVGKEPLRSKNRARLGEAGWDIEGTVLTTTKGTIDLDRLQHMDLKSLIADEIDVF